MQQQTSRSTRREFLKMSAATTATLLATAHVAAAEEEDRKIRVGLIGCGGRGTGAAINCLAAADEVEIWAMADAFPDHLQSSRSGLTGNKKFGERVHVPEERAFAGLDAYQKLLAVPEVNLVILATPPAFRPIHIRAAIEAGKHVFTEKPVAVDPVGVRSVIESAAMAGEKKLAIVAGTQRRHEAAYIETMKRIHDGAIGDLVAAQCYWNQGGLWNKARQPEWSDLEWQMRNWLYLTWLSGDHIVEQHIHNLDVMNWAFQGPPVKCVGMGGREVRRSKDYGHVFDHFAVEYVYANGVRAHSFCRQIDGCANRVGEHLVGTRGTANPARWIKADSDWGFTGDARNPYEQEHVDLIASIHAGEPLNEGQRVAESTLTAIMGRMSTYTGKEVTWERAMASELHLMPPTLEFGPPMVVPAVAVPGETKLL